MRIGMPRQGAREQEARHPEGARARVALGYYGTGLRPDLIVMSEQSSGHFTRVNGQKGR